MSELPDRTPAEMLEVIRRILARDVERLRLLSKDGRESLPFDERELLDETLDRVLKLAREERQRQEDVDPSKLTTEEIRKKLGQK